jgi:hypothetical protein
MPGSISGHVNQFPLDQFVVFGSFGRETLKIVDCEQGARRHGSILHDHVGRLHFASEIVRNWNQQS